MKSTLMVVEIVLAFLLVGSILLQQRGTSLGGAFGGEGNVYRSRRGAERVLFRATIVIALIFVGVAIAVLFV
jgi:protein translocase SecG subunit